MKTLLSSFTVKLFVWFWLIAITSIISTRFISQQLSNDSLSEVVTQEPKYDELEQLRKIARRIERSKIKSIGELFSTDKQKKLFTYTVQYMVEKHRQQYQGNKPISITTRTSSNT